MRSIDTTFCGPTRCATRAAWYPDPVPISSTRSPGTSRASSSMIAIIDGAEIVWPRPIGSGTSAYASSASSGRTNASRGTARNASRTPGSWMYREATSCSTRRARAAAKPGLPPIGRPPPTPGIKGPSRGDEEGNQDRRKDQGRQRDGQSRFHEVLHRDRDPVPRRDLHDDDVARGPEDRRVPRERRARGQREPELRRAARHDFREQQHRGHVADQVRQEHGQTDQPDEAAGSTSNGGREAALDRGREPGDAHPFEDDEQADEEQDDAPIHMRDQGPGRRLRKEREE